MIMKKNTIKNLIAFAILSLIGEKISAQTGLECVVVEKYYISNAADEAGSVGTLPVGSTTYRVWADLLPSYKFQALYGVSGHPMTIQTTTSFFNNEDRGATTPNSIGTAFINDNSVAIDSWFSVGAAASARLGTPKSEDDGLANLITGNPILMNNDPLAGIPLSTQDGIVTGTPLAVTFVGLTTELDVFDATSQFGNTFTTSNGSIAALGGAMGANPTTTNKVLLGQFTTDGVFSFELNIQIGTPTGGIENYVAQSPVGSETLLTCLTYNSSITTNLQTPVAAEIPSVSLYPNPSVDAFKIEINSVSKIFNNGFKIMNVLGAVVAEKSFGDIMGKYIETIDVSSFSKGIYFVELNLNGVKSTQKIIKK